MIQYKIGDVIKIDLTNHPGSDNYKMIVAVVITNLDYKEALNYPNIFYKRFNDKSKGWLDTTSKSTSLIDLKQLKSHNPDAIYQMLKHEDDDSFWLAQEILKQEGLL